MTNSSFYYLINFFWQNLKILFNSNDLTPIWKMRLHPSWSLARQYSDFISAQPNLIERLKARPNSSKFYSALVLSRAFPRGSLGDEYQQFLYRYKVGTGFYPETIELKDEIDFFNSHIIAIHDLWHVAMGFESSLLGEIKLSAFSVAQFRSPMHAGFLALALLAGITKKGEYLVHILDAICSGWRMGLQCQNVMLLDWENWLDKPLAALRSHISQNRTYLLLELQNSRGGQEEHF